MHQAAQRLTCSIYMYLMYRFCYTLLLRGCFLRQPNWRLHDSKRRLNGFELLESMHLLVPAGEVALTPDVDFSF
jgi:hypothetical protein